MDPNVRPGTRQPLLTQILAVNAALIAATVLASVAASQLDLLETTGRREALILTAAILAAVLVNGLVLRRRLAPLERLIAFMEDVDLGRPGPRVQVPDADSADVVRLHVAFNRMLGRLEEERHRSAAAVVDGQERERARVARDLHDEVNQALTGVLLRLAAIAHDAPEDLRVELSETQALATQAMDELLRLAHELRPTVLDDLGLEAALRTQLERFAAASGLATRLELCEGLDDLSPTQQTVVYRIVQESLSNVVRHARAGAVAVTLSRAPGCPLIVRILDDGRGFAPAAGAGGGTGGLGLAGMHERARLAGGRLDVQSGDGHGTLVTLVLDPAGSAAPARLESAA